jgi:hypothetical protein
MYSSYVYRAYAWWTDPRLPSNLVLFHPYIVQVLSLAILCEFIRDKYLFRL